MVRIAALDLGSNTFRLLVADVEPGNKLSVVAKNQIITRLSGDFDREKFLLHPEAIKRAEAALKKFADILKETKPQKINAQATEIARKASNGKEFLDRAAIVLGAEVNLLPAEREALLALKGIMAYNPSIEGLFSTLDIGGGSTEMVLADANGYRDWISLKLGVVDLAERVLEKRNIPSAKAIAKCEMEIASAIGRAYEKFGAPKNVETIIGTGGTATSVAAVDLGLDEYDEEEIQNHIIDYASVTMLEKRLTSLSFEERSKIFAIGGGREDVIIPGIMIIRIAMETFGTDNMTVSDAGLLEGLILIET